MRCEACSNGERRAARKPYVAQEGSRVAVVTDVPVEECAACGEVWFDEQVALTLDVLLTDMLATETFAVRPYPQAAPSAA
jgi:YgiT-type zinc finger domain-containing protein